MPPVVVVCPDLFFAAKIAAVARAAGAAPEFVAPADALARVAAAPPARVLLDLHAPGALELAAALAADPRARGIPVVGFHSHVDADLRRAALAAGVAEALPRSAFVARLPALLGAGATVGGEA